MLKSKFLSLVILLGLLTSQAIPDAMAATQCDSAQFVSDLTVPDGAAVAPGAAFTKTWRLMNNGTCAWTTSYNIVFAGGDLIGAPLSVKLPVNVPPGQTVDISVGLKALTTSGHYKGLWKLGNAAGIQFGIGASGTDPFWVDINVVEINAMIFDFVANAPYAQWKSGSGALPFPGTSGDSRGYSYQINNPHLEVDSIDATPGLLTVPENKFNGYIQATYPEFQVQQGDKLQTLVNCEFGATGCYVTFRIDYLTSAGTQKTLWSWKEAYDKRFYRANIDLSSLNGQKVRFVFMLLSSGLASGDRAIWGSPRIVRTGTVQPPAPPATLTALPALTPTATPFNQPPPTIVPSGCDKASFIADVTVPDGTLFSPGAAFTKTWRLKNAGSCTWTTAYKFLFYSGEQMGAPTSINMPRNVAPGQTVDLTVNMVAPLTDGKFRGNWILSNGNGALFGIGTTATMPIWVEINVAGTSPIGSGYDFTANVCSAVWKTGAGILPCPGTDNDARGFVLKQDAPKLEDGSTGAPGLLTFPQNRYNGQIQGFYPTFTVQPGDRFQSTVGCEFGVSCYVTFRLDYMNANGLVKTFWSWREQNNRSYYAANIDLSSLAGQSVRFILTILATGYSTNDRAIWGSPRIARVGGASPTATPVSPTNNWLTYTNSTYGFQFKYPPQSERFFETTNGVLIRLPIVPGTNLAEKYLDLRVLENAETCAPPLVGASQNRETVVINGTTFFKDTGEDAGAGQIHKWTGYSTTRNNVCVTFLFVLHSGNPDIYDPPRPVYNEAAESAVFLQMISTFAWLAPTPTPTHTLTPIPPTITPTSPTGDWLSYTNSYYGFQFRYPPRLEDHPSQDNNYVRIDLPFVQGTNLREKYLEVFVTENASTCLSPFQANPIHLPQPITINGIPFLKQTESDAGVGHVHQWVAYSTRRENVCVSLNFMLHWLQPGNFATPPPVFDFAAETAVFDVILSTFTWLPSTPVPTPTATISSPVTGLALVQSVEIQIVESQPLQANALVRGQLPDSGCTRISSFSQILNGNTFQIMLMTITDPLAVCNPVTTPFEQVIPLNVSNLPPARYTVNVNGTESTFELVTRDFTKFKQVVVDALNSPNFDLLKLLMDQSFVFGFWQSQGSSYTPDLAIEQLRINYVSTTTHLTPDPGKDLNALLGGVDPYAIMGLDPAKSQALFVSGWGLSGNDEAILYITRLPDGSLYWDKVLIAPGGFTNP